MQQRVLIVGLGISGRSAAELLLDQGYSVVASDCQVEKLLSLAETHQLLKKGLELVDEASLNDFTSFNFAILSPGIPACSSFVMKVKKSGLALTSEIELAFKESHHHTLAITGTNGKTTTTLFVEYLLNRSGKKAKALGNVGVPLAKEIKFLSQNDIIVAELSSFQLDSLKTPKLDQGVILNITPDHLDRYGTMENYAKSKISMAKLIKEKKPLIVNQICYEEFKPLFSEVSCITFGYGMESSFGTDFENVYYQGKKMLELPERLKKNKSFELENFLAAVALTAHLNLPEEIYREAFETFNKPKHRLAYITTISGVQFYNDSKGTNVDAVIKAVASIKKPIYLIAGGIDKGFPYTSWISAFEGKVKGIFAIGKAAPIIAEQLSHRFFVEICDSLQSATKKAYETASEGEVVLLSPGCASYDMFNDYIHRGEEFEHLVLNLPDKLLKIHSTHEGKI